MTARLPGALQQRLKQVSRSFYLTLRVLPSAVRAPIGLAYLLARATDTIADTEVVPLDQRRTTLLNLRNAFAQASSPRVALDPFLPTQSSQPTPEQQLLREVPDLFDFLQELSAEDQARIRHVLRTITQGQLSDLDRFGNITPPDVAALQTDPDLATYTYEVAGCVGEFWTTICCAKLFDFSTETEIRLRHLGIRYGRGLQLVNILRDLAADLRQGRCYIPSERLATVGLKPGDLLDPASEPAFRPIYDEYLGQAMDFLNAGWEYTRILPWRAIRLRLACAWPTLIGIQTLHQLKNRSILDPSQRVKIDRRAVYRTMLNTVLWYPLPRQWDKLAEASARSACHR